MPSILTTLLLGDAVAKYSPDQERDDQGRWTAGGGDPERHAVLERHGFKVKSQHLGEDFRGKIVATLYVHPGDKRTVFTVSSAKGAHEWTKHRNPRIQSWEGRGRTAADLDAHLQSERGKKSGPGDVYHWGRKV